jgi:hypothetical protein
MGMINRIKRGSVDVKTYEEGLNRSVGSRSW